MIPRNEKMNEKVRNVFESVLAQNGQITLKKDVRDELGLKPGDVVFCEVIKVVAPDGVTRYDRLTRIEEPVKA